MANVEGDWDPAAEQLYDELMSRTWAVHGVVGSSATDVTRTDVCGHLATFARHWVCARRGGDEIDLGLDALLWPSGARPDDSHPWWSTPLGRLMSMRPRSATSTRRDVELDVAVS
jgi:hypothetical protein